MSIRAHVVIAPAVLTMMLAACGSGGPASGLAKPPEFDPKGQTKCAVKASQSEPLIVEWPSPARGKLESQTRRGLVAVSYEGCEMRVLGQCSVPVKYAYSGFTRKRDRVTMRDENDLYANVPVGAARLEAKLARSGELNVQMTIVGRYEAERQAVRRDELQGDCAGATHVISAITVGAFDFYAGADAEVGAGATVLGAGTTGSSTAKRELLNEDGDERACEKATRGDKEPPEGCGAFIRVEVLPIVDAQQAAAPAVTTPATVPPPPSTAAPKPAPASAPANDPPAAAPAAAQPTATPDIVVTKSEIRLREKIRFFVGKGEIMPESFGLLDEVVAAMRAEPAMKIEVQGHTDSQGNDAANMRLSVDRANAVRAYLVAHGIDAARVTAKGYGSTQPVAPNDTPEGREHNRRVQVVRTDRP